jgi:hypothetical protein
MAPGTELTLPGGTLIGGMLVREAAFRPFTGRLEEELAELAEAPGLSRPARVTALLAAALAEVGGEPATPELVASLGFTDRQFLMLAFALEHRGDEQWRHLVCTRCDERFDVGFCLSALPVTPPGEGYPAATLALGERQLVLRMPTGADEERVALLEPAAARRALALACVVSIDRLQPTPAALHGLGDADIDSIDAALDAASPQLSTTLGTTCSRCGAAQTLELDPYASALPQASDLYQDVHALALRYHWSELDILALPRARRRLYLDLIDEGMHR